MVAKIPLFKNDTLGEKYLLVAGFLALAASVVINFFLLEYDGVSEAVRGGVFGDALSWATSARIKFLHGVWARPLDEHHYIVVPLHSLLVWLSYELHGLTLTGLRFPAFIMITLTKLLFCFIVYREMGKRYLIAALFFVACFSCLNEQTRLSNPESIQIGLLFLSTVLLYQADKLRKKYLFILSGFILSVVYFYKTNFFIMPALPLLYFLAKRFVLKEEEAIFSWRSGLFFTYVGFGLHTAIYLLFWIIPHMEEMFWLYTRGDYGGPPLSDLILGRLLDPLVINDNYLSFFTEAHFLWLGGFILLATLMPVLNPKRFTRFDAVFLAYAILAAIQLSVTPWWFTRRVLILMPFGCWAFMRLLHLALSARDHGFKENFGFFRPIVLIAGIYWLLTYWVHTILATPRTAYVVAAILALPLGLVLLYLTKTRPRTVWAILGLLMVLCVPLTAKNSLEYFTKNTTMIRDGSEAMGKVVGESRVFGGYFFQLYNRSNAIYVSTWTTNLIPDGFGAARVENLTMPEFARKYRLWVYSLADIFRALVINRFFFSYYYRWDLPPDYRQKYHSDVFITPPPSAVTSSQRYLLVGASEDDVYVTRQFCEDFFKPYANKIPILGPALLDLKRPGNTPDQPFQMVTLHKVLGWKPAPDK